MKTLNLKKKGFTIVELVIVIAVIAILAAILIPTFVNITKKANLSADMVAVKEMNTILAAEEITDGKPATVVDAQEVLKSNGINDFTPMSSNNVFYWVGTDNRVILWEWGNDEKTTGKVTYPDELVKKYKDVTEVSAAWSNLDTEFTEETFVEVVPEEGETLKDALLTAIENATDGSILKLPANENIQLATGGLYWLGQAIKKDGGTGKAITIDLNGGTLSSTGSNARFVRDSEGNWVIDEEGDYVMNVLEVPANGELVLANGKINIEHGKQPTLASIMAESGSKLVVRDIVLNTSTAGIMPSGEASEVVIENSTINALNYALGTNRMESSNIKLTISNSNLSVTYATAVLINTPSDTHIYNSTITGIEHGIALRAGSLTIEDSTIVTTDPEPGIYSYKDFASGYNFQGYWGTGNTIPAGTIVLGDYAKANPNGTYSYSGNVSCTLKNTKLQTPGSDIIPEVLLASSDPSKIVSLTYDGTSTVGKCVLYGEIWDPTNDNVDVVIANKGTIKVNNVEKDLGIE